MAVDTLRALCARAAVQSVDGAPIPDVAVKGVADDSRAVRPGDCFVAVRGVTRDGHAFIPQAVAAGAVAVIAEAPASFDPDARVPIVRVGDSREAIARLAACHFGVERGGANELHLVGVTGTNGKTTVAWLVRAILDAAGKRCALLGTIEYDLAGRRTRSDLTTPGAAALCRMLKTSRDAGARFGVLEVSSHALDQRRCDGLTFDAAVFTNLTGDHLDYHRTMDAYFAAKARLFRLCDERSTAIVNHDDPRGRHLAETLAISCVSFGLESPTARARAQIRHASRLGSEVRLQLRRSTHALKLSLVGRHNVSNALAAALVCEALGVDAATIERGLASVRGVPGRLQRVEPQGCPFSVFIDYAHTDAALDNVLTTLRPITTGRLICVFGCGGDRDRTKRPRMGAVASQRTDVAFVTSDNPRTEDPEAIINQIISGVRRHSGCSIHVNPDRQAAIEAAIEAARPGDTVLIAGKGHEDYQIIGTTRRHFDDAEVAAACLDRYAAGKGAPA